MPKMKTKSGVKKRFRVTRRGKVVKNNAYKSHLLTKKTRARKRRLRKKGIMAAADAKRIKKLIAS